MNAKQAEQVTGISRRNLRFYEQQGLIHPQRDPSNDYRDYSQQDIAALKRIRALRMLDVPLEEISEYLQGNTTVAELSVAQELRLRQRQQELERAIGFCRQMQQLSSLDDRFLESLLAQMDAPDVRRQLFGDWKKDYQKVARAEAKKAFSFTPDEAIQTPEEFTQVLCQYGSDHNLNLVITKEGLEPEFEIDSIPYTAQRIYRRMGPVPVMIVRCTALHPEALTANVPGFKGWVMRLLCNGWPLILFGILWLPRVTQAAPENRWEIGAAGAILALAIGSMYWVFRHYRD